MCACFYRFCGFLVLLYLLAFQTLTAQDNSTSWTETVDYFLSENQPEKADSVLQNQKTVLIEKGKIDSLYQFPYYIGKITNTKQNASSAIKEVESFIANLKTKTTNARTLYKAYLSLEDLRIELGDDAGSLEAAKTALTYAEKLPDLSPDELGKINYHIGGDYYALYNLSEALVYFRASARAYEKSNTVQKQLLADAYNGMATAMWTLNKLDSAQVYYNKAIATTKESNLKGFDRTYYIVSFEFNLALVIDAQGKLGEAIEMKRKIIPQLQEIIQNSKDDYLVTKAKRLLASSVSNLAAFYNDTGYLTKAYEMLQYAYEKKKAVYDNSSPRIATALTQIAVCEYELREFDKSIATANFALTNLKTAPSQYYAVEADIYSVLAKSYAAKEHINEAKEFYEQAQTLFHKAYPDAYSRGYLTFSREYSQFLANHNDFEKAIAVATKIYDYVAKEGTDNVPLTNQIANLSEIYYKAGDYAKAHSWAVKGNKFLDRNIVSATATIDSVQAEFRRPAITLMEVQSLYKMTSEKDPTFIREQLQKIDKAVASLERRKTTAFSLVDINSVLTEYKALNTLSKKLYYELYQQTKEQHYLDKTISLHESGIYNRLRTQFNIKKGIRFGSLPVEIIAREKQLKEEISNALRGASSANINSYFTATEQWEQFLDTLKINYPKYYALRYATIEGSLGNLQKKIPKNSTVVRYFFIEDSLYAFVISQQNRSITALPISIKSLEKIKQLGEDQNDFENTSILLTELYTVLWKPIESNITTQNVIIIPDRELFNLSFETLTPTKVSNFNALGTQSLLSKHTISYNYSLFLLNDATTREKYKSNFVAFAPEFNEKMKENYKVSITDSARLDKTYVTLLPQPFSTKLVKKYATTFDGTSYINEQSTKQVFKNNAKEHKIIHIGTHAESNNLTPEFSRLIFAKDISEQTSDEDNSLFTYEIYDYNLTSNLTILTACETGKPGFEPGEGMISLAHAFNYAGSESMLTSLWKIDEKSSTEIISLFYENLSNGMRSDEALRQAKIAYITSANGRTVAPHYWAGLVLIGDTAPLTLNASFPFWYWIVGAVLLIGIVFFIFRRKK